MSASSIAAPAALGALLLRAVIGLVAVLAFATLFGSRTPPRSQADFHRGVWNGLDGPIAPNRGTINLELHDTGAVSCGLWGSADSAAGNGWFFRGTTEVTAKRCVGARNNDGTLEAELELLVTWAGRIKGWDSDWEDTAGKRICVGRLQGSVAAGGTWRGICNPGPREWRAELRWHVPVSEDALGR